MRVKIERRHRRDFTKRVCGVRVMFRANLRRSSVMACASREFGQKYAIGIDAVAAQWPCHLGSLLLRLDAQ